ncbi:hypothetical protein BSLG_009879 [Batrachochytrium salamandrivorans]|nr:hypothetical protein BSLG_009879 [Batrachochytrium salamandrivorans]
MSLNSQGRSSTASSNNNSSGAGSQPRKTVVGFSPSVVYAVGMSGTGITGHREQLSFVCMRDLIIAGFYSIQELDANESDNRFGGVQDISRRKPSAPNADIIVSSQLSATSLLPVVSSAASTSLKVSHGRRGSITMSFPSVRLTADLSKSVCFPDLPQKAKTMSTSTDSLNASGKDSGNAPTGVNSSPSTASGNKASRASKQDKTQHTPRKSKSVGGDAGPRSVDPSRKFQKDMTKAERRELQERQRAEKKSERLQFFNRPSQKHFTICLWPVFAMRTPAQMRFDDTRTRSKIQKASSVVRIPAQKPVTLFSHLIQYEHENVVFAENKSWHISKQVDFLSNMRSLCVSMKSAIRKLKSVISELSIDTPDEDAKVLICQEIESYIDLSIIHADTVIVSIAIKQKKIKNGDVILTFARSSIVLKLLLEAHAAGIQFSVVVADGRPKLEGKEMLRRLIQAGIKCTYILTNALPFAIKEVTKVFLGASTVLSNGDVMARGNFCGRSDDLVDISNLAPSSRLTTAIPNPDPKTVLAHRHTATNSWRDIDQLKLLNLYYDITPAKFITMIICESGQIPSNSVLIIIRDYNEPEAKSTRI